jgi:uncharacterized protein (TIGR03790 family)
MRRDRTTRLFRRTAVRENVMFRAHLGWAVGLLLLAGPAHALEPKDVFVVGNRNVPASKEVAEHYCARRGVPRDHIVLLDLPAGEDISRADYDAKLAGPLREALRDRKDAARVLLTVYGVPLRVGGQQPTADEKKQLDELGKELDAARREVAGLEKDKATPADALARARGRRDRLERRRRALAHAESYAAVDSELMCLWWGAYPLDRWVRNPLYFQARAADRERSGPTLLTARLDGPTPAIARRLVDDAVAVEAKGLAGTVCVDARGIRFDPKGSDTGRGYAGYDESMREMARLFAKAGFEVTLDDRAELLAPGSARNVALYCGWYSLANYVDCCEFAPGAVAWHLASSEAVTLRDPKSRVWCPNLLKKGVAATLGPVGEPYTVGFPKPEEFFGFLATGEYSLVECYARSQLFCSWMTVLVGDPLYTPFRRNARVRPDAVHPSPKGGRPAG